MKKYKNWIITGVLALATLIFTIIVRFVDRSVYDVTNTAIGCSKLNLWFSNFAPYDTLFYSISKYLGYLIILYGAFYVLVGVFQAISRKSLKKVDIKIYILAISYIIAGIVFLLFDKAIIVNYRPILENKIPAVSYPSTHTLFSTVIFGTALIINKHFYNEKFIFKTETTYALVRNATIFFGAAIIICRALSGVHWLTDIIGGLLFGTTIVYAFYSVCQMIDLKKNKEVEEK